MEWSDAAAADDARKGNQQGFRVLVERYSHSLFRLAYRMTGNEHDAEVVPVADMRVLFARLFDPAVRLRGKQKGAHTRCDGNGDERRGYRRRRCDSES